MVGIIGFKLHIYFDIGIEKDYFMCMDEANQIYWCSSATWIFSLLPKPLTAKADVDRLKQINTFFTGEFDQVLYEAKGEVQVIDPQVGLRMAPKPVTELDRLSFVMNRIANYFAIPKGFYKFTPNEKFCKNEAFKGLQKQQMCDIGCWQFTRYPKDQKIREMIARGEGVYNVDCLDSVANDLPKNSWSI